MNPKKKVIFIIVSVFVIAIASVIAYVIQPPLIYDDLSDNILNETLWFNQTLIAGDATALTNETGGFLEALTNSQSGNRAQANITTRELLNNTEILNISFTTRTQVTAGVTTLSGISKVIVFGNILSQISCTNCNLANTTNFTLRRIINGSFDVYANDIFEKTILPTNSNITIDSFILDGSSEIARTRIFPITYTPQVSINKESPSDGSSSSSSTIEFNSELFSSKGLINATLFIWNSTAIFNQTSISLSGNSQSFSVNVSNFTLGNYEWNVLSCGQSAENDICNFDDDGNNSLIISFVENENTYNSTTYETASESFITNFTAPDGVTISSANLIWNGTSYAGTIASLGGNDRLLTRTITIPEGIGLKNWYWNLNFNSGEQQNLSGNTQQVDATILTYCNSTINVPYMNFTFKDESTEAAINAQIDSSSWTYYLGGGSVTKSLSYSNSSEIPSYAFCFTPPDRTVNFELSNFQYSSTDYPQRRYTTSGTLSNSTTNQVLYLLGSSDGIYSNIQIVNVAGFPIIGATVTAERQIDGDWIVIEQGTSDSSGTVTFWVNPNIDTRITASASGYLQAQVTIRPTSTGYTLTLSSTQGNASFDSNLEGLTWRFEPGVGVIPLNETAFNATITAQKDNIVSCEFRLTNQTGNISSTTSGCSSSGGNLSIVYTPSQNEKINGILYVDLGEGLFILDGDAYWIGYNSSVSSWRTLRGILGTLNEFNEFGEGVEQEFSKIVFFFLVLTIGLGILTFFSGYDFSNPGFTVPVVYGIILFATLSGWFTFDGLVKPALVGETISDILDKYIYLVMMTFFFGGWLFNMWRKQS